MSKNYKNNTTTRFLKATGLFWSSAAKYQTFMILAAIALLVTLPLFSNKLDNTSNIIFNIIVLCAVAAGGFVLLKTKGSKTASFTFAAALFLRLCLILVLENSTPVMPEYIRKRVSPCIKHYDTILFQADEYLYTYQGQRYRDVTLSEFINSPEISSHAYRASFLTSRLLRFFGGDFLWPRIFGAFLGAFTAAIVTLAAEKLFCRSTVSIVSLITILAPQTAFYSVKFLKEIWIIFAASLMVWSFTIIIQNKRLLPAIFSIAAAVTLLFWVRFEYALMFLAAVPITLCFRYKCGFAEKLISVILMALITIIISSYQFNQLTQKAENMAGKYARMERGQRGNLETVEVLNKIYLSRGPLRLFNVPMSMLNPPPKNLHHVYTKENKLYEIERQVNIYQWWIPLPFLIIGAIRIISKRTELLALSLPYLITICTAAILIGGLEPNLLRYRDSLAPIAFIIIGLGIESFMIKSKPWKKLTILSVYSLFAMLVVYLYMRGF